MKATCAGVNKLLRQMGIDAKLYAGRGYYYWDGNACVQWPSIYVYRIGDLTLAEVMTEVTDNLNNPAFKF